MKNKSIVTLIILILVIIVIAIIYGYSKIPEQTNSNQANINLNTNNTETTNSPSINVTPESHNFDTVIYGEVAKHTFTITNTGDEPLKILRLSTSCGCTKASVDENDKIIAPGQSIEMLVTFDPAVHDDDSDLGDVTRIVYIKTNDPNNPEIEVEIQANVITNNN